VVEPVQRGDFPTQASPVEGRDADRPVAPRVLVEDRPGIDTVEAPVGLLLKVLWRRAAPDDPGLRISGDRGRVLRFLRSRLTA
jgi:hypothetical protein